MKEDYTEDPNDAEADVEVSEDEEDWVDTSVPLLYSCGGDVVKD